MLLTTVNLMMFTEWLFIVLVLILYFYFGRRSRILFKELKKKEILAEIDQAREQAMLSSIGDGVVATDKDGAIIFVNQAAKEMIAWDDSMIGKRLSEVSLLADETGKHVAVEKHPLHLCLVKHKKIISTNYHFVKKDKMDLAVYISAMPIFLKDKIIGAIEVFRDITQEKEIDRIKSEFVFLASHQLRTPLSTINWYVEMLMSGDAGPLNEDQKNYLKEVYRGNQRMVEMVNDLLNVSRLDLGTLAVQLVPTDLKNLIEEETKSNLPTIEDKKMTVNCLVNPEVKGVEADIKMVKMLLQNLITNAIKYTPQGGKIDIKVEPQGKKDYILSVADNGYGIPEEAKEKIFTKLYRADNVMAKEITGTGLGLYMVKSIVEKLQGKIWFESQVDKGTTFFVSFPLKPVIKKKILSI
ncbi:MAG: PAS domain-containing protein [Candidatus Magasanikbacteria bacterium]|nr:PAS domain-containing protein [Candidatus Magasanikbacteria bacterium]